MGYSIGISAYFHESSVSLFRDGDLISFIREEYFSRVKGDKNFPRLALNHLIKEFSLLPESVDYVAFYEKPLLGFLNTALYALKHLPASKDLIFNNLLKIRHSGLFFGSELQKHISIPRKKLIFCPHHLSHVLSTLPFFEKEEPHAAIVIDGVGDLACTSIFEVRGEEVRLLDSIDYPQSLGLMYSAITDYLGFNINDGEYKVMALASYGKGYLNSAFSEVVEDNNEDIKISSFDFYKSLERSYGKRFIEVFGSPFDKLEAFPEIGVTEFQRGVEIAYSAQNFLEQKVGKLFDKVNFQTGQRNFSLSGGVALNSKLIFALSQKKYVDTLFVPPNPSDSGAAIGAGAFGAIKSGFKIKNSKSAYLGPTPIQRKQPDIIEDFLTVIEHNKETYRKVAELIIEGEIVGLINGRIEVGHRALGHRSLVCDPRNNKAVEKLSQKLKKREKFRPLAPACLATHIDDWFVVPDNIRGSLLWMGCLVRPTEKCFLDMPAICHVDETARVQLVEENGDPFDEILGEFYKLTGTPILVNTSFNCGGDPIVLDIQDAILSSLRMNLEYIIIERTLFKTKKL